MFKIKIPGAIWVEKLLNKKRKEFCGPPCTFYVIFIFLNILLLSTPVLISQCVQEDDNYQQYHSLPIIICILPCFLNIMHYSLSQHCTAAKLWLILNVVLILITSTRKWKIPLTISGRRIWLLYQQLIFLPE